MLPPEDILSAFKKLSPTSETRAGSNGDDIVSFYNYMKAYLLKINQLETSERTRKRRSKTSEATDRQIRGAELLYSEKRLTMEQF